MITNEIDYAQDELLKYVAVRKINREKWTDQVVPVIQEMPITVLLNGREVVTLLCTGSNLEALAVGFLRSEMLINKPYDIQNITLDEKKGEVYVITKREVVIEESLPRKRAIASGCGKGTVIYTEIQSGLSNKVESSLTLYVNQIFFLMSQLIKQSELYRKTRGVHNAALANLEKILLFRADIGRHNAVDMIYGTCFLENISFEDKILLTTGRITSELILKVAKMRIPVVLSRHVATYHAISLAQNVGMTVVGDVRAEKFVVYTHPERIKR